MKTGPRPKYTQEQKDQVIQLKAQKMTVRQIAETMGVPSTFVSDVLSPRKTNR